tara:strand:- start:577 stop:1269 length:693 start_codon:yes stop_codon:yes gene_type:complete
MSEIRVENIIGETGTDAVKFTKGINVTGVTTATSFSGSGANLTSLPAGNLTGTLPAISGANLTGIPQKVKQVKYQVFNTLVSTNSTSYSDTGIAIAMTPTSASNKLIFSGQIALGVEKDCSANFQVYIDSGSGYSVTEEARGPDRNNRTRATTGQGYFLSIDDEEYMIKEIPLHVVLDCDNTNQHTVKLYWNNSDGSGRTIYINRSHNDNNEGWIPSYTSHFTLMEVEMS